MVETNSLIEGQKATKKRPVTQKQNKPVLNRYGLEASKTAFAKGAALKSSVYKINQVAALIRNKKADEALLQLKFSPRKAASYLREILHSAIYNAEHNHNLDVDNLYISKILVNHGFYLKRYEARARGRSGKRLKPYSLATIFVSTQ